MKSIIRLQYLFSISFIFLLLMGCTSEPKFAIGDYIMPKNSSDIASILKVVGVNQEQYKVFTHFLSQGHLVMAEDYLERNRKEIDKTYIKILQPKTESTFSPGKYLSEKTQ